MSAILVIAPAWVGDMVMAQSLFMTLKAQDDARVIDVLAPGWTRALTERMPEVRDTIEMPLGHGDLGLLTRRRLGMDLRARDYQQVIVLPNSLKSALVPYWARIPLRSGYVGEMRQWLLNDCRRLDKQRAQRLPGLSEASLHWPGSSSKLTRPSSRARWAPMQK